jgi:hypothetical protein
MNTDTPKLFAALVQAQKHARAVDHDGNNKHHGYRYASAENLINEGRTSLSAAGLTLFVTTVVLFAKELLEGVVQNMIKVTYVLAHESGEAITYEREWPAIEQKGRPIDKAQGGALTASLGYAIRDLLLLPRGDEYADMDRRDDREVEEPRRAPPREPRREEPRHNERPREEAKREEPRREERRDDPPPDSDRRATPTAAPAISHEESEKQWDSMLAAIKAGQSIRDQLATCTLPDDKRLALAYISRALKTDSEPAFLRVLGEAGKEPSLSVAIRGVVKAECRAHWDTLQAAKKKDAAA